MGVGCCLFFFNDTATTEIYTLSLHDALPIFIALPPTHGAPAHRRVRREEAPCGPMSSWSSMTAAWTSPKPGRRTERSPVGDRKSTRLNSSHANISYAVFCLKKKISHDDYVVG